MAPLADGVASSREGGSNSSRPLVVAGDCGSQASASSEEVVLPIVDREEVDTAGSLDVAKTLVPPGSRCLYLG
ncbi:hypothetical protein SUGI_1018140 [Cryptomeria japonica]|nr:hypothetical protein SUGI_1018140 [Cryptomeria japonica]